MAEQDTAARFEPAEGHRRRRVARARAARSRARKLLELRQSGGGTAALKFTTLRRWTSARANRASEAPIAFTAAQPGRFTTWACNFTTCASPEINDVPGAIAAVATGFERKCASAGLPARWKRIGHITRAAITPRPGSASLHRRSQRDRGRGAAFIAAPRPSLSSGGLRSQRQARGRAVLPDRAADLRPAAGDAPAKPARPASLAFQYQGGIGAYRRITGDQRLPEETLPPAATPGGVDHPEYVQFWRLSVFQAVQAIRTPAWSSPQASWPSSTAASTGFLELPLPSGRILTYPKAEIDRGRTVRDDVHSPSSTPAAARPAACTTRSGAAASLAAAAREHHPGTLPGHLRRGDAAARGRRLPDRDAHPR